VRVCACLYVNIMDDQALVNQQISFKSIQVLSI
jgi:hypothetical protein